MLLSQVILLVDDHLLFADSVKFMLESSDMDSVVQVYPALSGALDVLASNAAVDLVLLDYAMPDINGLEAISRICAVRPAVKVAFLSGLDEPQIVNEALRLGAVGWLPKSMSGESLVSILKLILAGQRYMPADLLLTGQETPLTPREQDVAALLARGFADKEIAEKLSLQTGTVKVHVKSILRKFSTSNRTQFALRYRGL